MSRKTIGILGGMGPLATVDLYRKIIEATPARTDQDHVPVIIDADPRIPDRTAALLEGGEDPLPFLVRGTRRLTDAGAAFIAMPCNTAHAYLPAIHRECPAIFIDMIDEAARVAAASVPAGSAVGILATRGTISAGIYQAALQRHGLISMVPDDEGQEQVMRTIYGVKSGLTGPDIAEPAAAAARNLIEQGVAALLAACTELPVVLDQEMFSVPLIDPTETLAHAAVKAATDSEAFTTLQQRCEEALSHVT